MKQQNKRTNQLLSSKGHEEFWSKSAETYFKELYANVKDYPSLILRHRYILDLLGIEKGRILDIGCGPGEMVADLVDLGNEAYGMDIATGMLMVASRNLMLRHGYSTFAFQCGNIEKLPYRDKVFDGVVCAGVIEYLQDDDKALVEIYRVLRRGGKLIITVRNKACIFRIADLLADRVKQSQKGTDLVNRTRRKIGLKSTRFVPYRKHFPWEIDRTLKMHGFEKVDFRYFHFYPFFSIFNYFFPTLFLNLGLKMERLRNTQLGVLGSGYIVKALRV
jgi:ubiquinone/menaquinone biosynthesis C-methylase UbiE